MCKIGPVVWKLKVRWWSPHTPNRRIQDFFETESQIFVYQFSPRQNSRLLPIRNVSRPNPMYLETRKSQNEDAADVSGGDRARRGGSCFQPDSRGQQRRRPGSLRAERERLDQVVFEIGPFEGKNYESFNASLQMLKPFRPRENYPGINFILSASISTQNPWTFSIKSPSVKTQ